MIQCTLQEFEMCYFRETSKVVSEEEELKILFDFFLFCFSIFPPSLNHSLVQTFDS